jgi:uncharacterized protein (DUF362 family)
MTPNVYFDKIQNSSYSFSGDLIARRALNTAIRTQISQFSKPVFKVFLLCNFVYHRRSSESAEDYTAKTTHPAVIRLALQALFENSDDMTVKVSIGNSPLQSASWDRIVDDSKLTELVELYNNIRPGFGVELADLRMNVQPRDFKAIENQRCNELSGDIIQIDLGVDSLLDDHRTSNHQYRVLDYPAERIERLHGPGKHVYLVHRKILESNLIISIPKLKTHEKVGMTAGIKGCVGIVPHKDCLAHHRVGAPNVGGDEYPKHSFVRKWQMLMHHRLYALPLNRVTWFLRLIDRGGRKLFQLLDGVSSGAWRGNDTAWRMSLDLARITLYGSSDGTMHQEQQRAHFVLTDGVIAGEGQGPLDPVPLPFGWLAFSANLVLADLANALVMGFRQEELPIVREAFALKRFPLLVESESLIAKGPDPLPLTAKELFGRHGKRFRLPKGW